MIYYRKNPKRHYKWLIAALVFTAGMVFTLSEVHGAGLLHWIR